MSGSLLFPATLLLCCTFASAHAGTLYTFTGGADGGDPGGNLVSIGSTLYGTTSTGPAAGVFSLDLAGTERVLFLLGTAENPGALPNGLTPSGARLYGTTFSDLHRQNGTIFRFDPASGTGSTIYQFRGGQDGSEPLGRLTSLNGLLYGTTSLGGGTTTCGTYGCGTVFAVTPSGREHIIYRFQNLADGEGPASGLLAVNGVLYGTTFSGGAYGQGTVFSMTPQGSKTTLFSFQGGSNGANPDGPLTFFRGKIYGTALNGGVVTNHCNTGCGTVFAITLSGIESTVYAFKGGADGASPSSALVPVGNSLYGTTFSGGTYRSGTVFSLTGSTEKVLHAFKPKVDGQYPSDLLDRAGTFYCPTLLGGKYDSGTVFFLSRP